MTRKSSRAYLLFAILLACNIMSATCVFASTARKGSASTATNSLKDYSPATQPRPFDGYTLFSPIQSNTTYLINNSGEIVHTWESDSRPGLAAYLLENGVLLRTSAPSTVHPVFYGGGACERVQKIDWNGTVTWEFEYSSNQYLAHHDAAALPNGNVLMVAWEYKTELEALAAGRNPLLLGDRELWPDHIIEVEPTGVIGGNIVWEWHMWDHLIQDYNSTRENFGVVADHPELIDINYVGGRGRADWTHTDSIDYNEEFDQILISVHNFGEIWVIDHSTTTEEAAGHTGGNSGKGGDLLYRWGNPQAYGAGEENDQMFFAQHDAQWIEPDCPGAGDILVFNNGLNRLDGAYSSVDEILPPVDGNGHYSLTPGPAYGPEEQNWIYTAEYPPDFYSQSISGAQRLPNGNTLICDGRGGLLFEVTLEKETVWEYLNTIPDIWTNNVFKARRYGRDFPGLLELINPHDVAVSNATVDKTTVIKGQGVLVEASVENQGVFAETFNVTVYANTTQIGRETVNSLDQNTSQALNFLWDTGSFAAGIYSVSVVADIVADETDTLDNVFACGVVNVRVLSHDVAIDSVVIFKTVVGFGYSTHGNVTATNHGDFTETFNLTINVNTTVLESFINITLGSLGSTTVTFSWNTSGHIHGNYSISAYASPVDGETDLADNILTSWVVVTIPGDVDGNGVVNIYDIVVMSGAYGAREGDHAYEANCDINGDGRIDIYDVVLAAGNYGKT